MSLMTTTLQPRPGRPTVAASPAADGLHPRSLVLALAACFAAVSPLHAQPVGAQVILGAAAINQNGSVTTITTQNGAGTSHSAINWQSFSIPAGSTTQFNQPSAVSTSINRVLGNNPSAIFGTLSSNGRLVLVNPAGIAVGAGAVVDTAGFTASTLRMSDADALAGRLRFGGDGLGGGALSVQGQVVTRGGDVVLISPQVDVGAAAVVQSIGGDTLVAAGQKVELTGRGLEGIHLELQAPTDRVLNLGTLKGDSVALFASQLKHSGLVQAQSASLEGGKVVLKGGDSVEVSGRVTAQRGEAGSELGGRIYASAHEVQLASTAVLDASAPGGGGEVLVGGSWQGKAPWFPNAQTTAAQAGSVLRADATRQGDGGTVVLWSDGVTRTAATISARGGPQGGDGGRVETSGKTLVHRGMPDVSAPQGKAGIWLLDPDFIELINGYSEGPAFEGTVNATDPGSVTSVYVSDLNDFNGNIVLEANHAIYATGSYSIIPRGDLTLRTINATEPPASPPSPFDYFNKGIDLSNSFGIYAGNNGGAPANVLIEAGTAATPVSGVQLRLPWVSSEGYANANQSRQITLRSAGDLSVAGISSRSYSTLGGSGGNVLIEARNGHVEVGEINTGTYGGGANDRAGNVTINGRTIHLTGNIYADGVVSTSQGAAPGNISITSGWNCVDECASSNTLVVGATAPAPPASAPLGNPMSNESFELQISARGGLAPGSGQPVNGGSIVLQALNGNIVFTPEQDVSVQAYGPSNSTPGNMLAGIGGGHVEIKALVGTISAGYLNVDAGGGSGADRYLEGGIPAGRAGGAGGSVDIRAGLGINVSDQLIVNASGGYGGRLDTDGGTAGAGGQGGNVTVQTTAGNFTVSNYLSLDASGGEGGGAPYSASIGTLAAGGAGGAVNLKAPTLLFNANYGSYLGAYGGSGGHHDDQPSGLPPGEGGAGGMVSLEATSSSGRIQFGSGNNVIARSGYPSSTTTPAGTVNLRAGSGGISMGASSYLSAGTLHLDSPINLPNTLGDVSILGDQTIYEVFGPIANPSVDRGSLGTGPASLTLESYSDYLRLGGGSSRALSVAGDITIRGPSGGSYGGHLIVADQVQSNSGSINLLGAGDVTINPGTSLGGAGTQAVNVVGNLISIGGPIQGQSVNIEAGSTLYVSANVRANNAGGPGISMTSPDAIYIGHKYTYADDVHVTSAADIYMHAPSIYLRHTIGTPTGTPRATPPAPELPTVAVKADGTLTGDATSDATFEVNATNTGGLLVNGGVGLNVTSPNIVFVGGSGPNQYAIVNAPTVSLSTTPVITPGTGLNSFAQAGTTLPTFAPLPAPPGPAPAPAPTPPAPPAPTPPAPTPPAPTPPAPTPPAPTPPAPPAPAPTPAPTPASAPVVDRIVDILRNDTSRAEIQNIVNQVDNTVTTFVALLIREESRQSEEQKKNEDKKESITVIDTQQCK